MTDLAKTSGTSPPPQADTIDVSAASIIRDPLFRHGVEEYRAGKRPDFDKFTIDTGAWEYERGRLWAALAPRNLKVSTRGQSLLVFRGAVV
jgi:hypothetical protein